MSNLTKAEFKKPGSDQHVYIATPAHTIYPNFHISLIRSIQPILDAGIGVTIAHLAGHCHVDDARNLLVADFLKTRCTDLLFWDADVACQSDGALRLLKHDVHLIGGAYPLKDGSDKFPIRLLNGWDVVDENGLLDVEALPTGFLRISRTALIALDRDSDRVIIDGQSVSLVFVRGKLENGNRIGGDMNFCRRWKNGYPGARVLCDPSLLFTHCGMVDFAGRLSDHMNKAEAAE